MENKVFKTTMSDSELASKVSEIFGELGYSLEQGSEMEGEYGKGSKIMRILLGAFASRYVFNFKIADSTFTLSKHTVSSMSGGALGHHKYKNEFERVSKKFEEEFSMVQESEQE